MHWRAHATRTLLARVDTSQFKIKEVDSGFFSKFQKYHGFGQTLVFKTAFSLTPNLESEVV
jgi:hypothetical protein